jgi:hypothetical protein
MFFCVLHHPMDAESNGCRDTQLPTRKFFNFRLFSGDQVVVRQKKRAHHQEYGSDLGVVFNVSSHLYGFCCESDCMLHVGLIYP